MLEREAGVDAEDTNRRFAARLPVLLDVPEPYEARARYAIRMLLNPLGLVPKWRRHDEAGSEVPSLYYGPAAPASRRTLSLAYSEAAAGYLSRPPSHPPEAAPSRRRRDEPPAPFVSKHGEADIVASTFFWLSGWQEYVIHERDEHGRFTSALSVQERWGAPTEPLVDVYREVLEERLVRAGVEVRRTSWRGRPWALAPTHDVDYVRKWRPGIIKRELLRSLRNPRHAARVVRQLKAGDPIRRSMKSMLADVERVGGRATWLVKAGGRDSRDVSYPLADAALRRLLTDAAQRGFEVGLHPSYHASTDDVQLYQERDRLRKALPQAPAAIRSHYLRFRLPDTMRLYERAGFRADSTLGFPDREGFRFATCHPFRLFDIHTNRETELWEIPLTFMDAALFNRRGYGVEEAIEHTSRLLATCRRHGGVCVGLWHNVLDDHIDYPGWQRHFRAILETAAGEGAFIGTLSEIFDCAARQRHAPSSASIRTTPA